MLPILNRNFDLFDSFFDNSFFGDDTKLRKNEIVAMKTDILEKDGKYEISVDLPGYDKEEINVEFENGYLTISAEKNEDTEIEEKGYIKRERFSGSCRRSFYVGDNISDEDIKAKYKNGILKISVPKKEEEKETKKLIDID